MNESVLELAHGVDNPRNSEGAFLLTKDGKIHFIYETILYENFRITKTVVGKFRTKIHFRIAQN